jgi:hypothetical protein
VICLWVGGFLRCLVWFNEIDLVFMKFCSSKRGGFGVEIFEMDFLSMRGNGEFYKFRVSRSIKYRY